MLGVVDLASRRSACWSSRFGTIVLLQWFLAGTRTGRQMQATAQNPTVARILGVPVERMMLYTFLINAALAAMASLLISPIYLAKFSNGETLGLVAFVAAIVGGFNQVRGAIVGGLLIGVVDNLAAAYVSTAYRQAVPLVLLVLIILFRPQGLLGPQRGARGMTARAGPLPLICAAGLALVVVPLDLTSIGIPYPGCKRYGTYILTLWLVTAIAAMGVNLIVGYAGQETLAQAAFLGIGAYTTALMTKAGVPFGLRVPGLGRARPS